MRIIDRLKKEARQTAVARGHKLGRFETLAWGWAEAICQQCGGWVQVKTDPLPNEVAISGDTMGLNCEAT